MKWPLKMDRLLGFLAWFNQPPPTIHSRDILCEPRLSNHGHQELRTLTAEVTSIICSKISRHLLSKRRHDIVDIYILRQSRTQGCFSIGIPRALRSHELWTLPGYTPRTTCRPLHPQWKWRPVIGNRVIWEQEALSAMTSTCTERSRCTRGIDVHVQIIRNLAKDVVGRLTKLGHRPLAAFCQHMEGAENAELLIFTGDEYIPRSVKNRYTMLSFQSSAS